MLSNKTFFKGRLRIILVSAFIAASFLTIAAQIRRQVKLTGTNRPFETVEFTPTTAPLTQISSTPNPINEPRFFVTEQYLDFLNRFPDDPGLNFWESNITHCGTDPVCTETQRINTSAAFFLSIEFQNTGYLVYRTYKVAYGNIPGTPVPITLQEFLPDTQQIGNGVVVNQGDWQTKLENNKQAYFTQFAERDRFTTLYPSTISPEQFVDSLNSNSNSPLSLPERDSLVNDLKTNAKTRAQVIRAVAEDSDLQRNEFNKAFVLMQYFGYLKRNPNDSPDSDFSGWMFWLNKLNEFGGNFERAEMVKAFLASTEYQGRFDTQIWNTNSNPQLGFSFRYPTFSKPTSVALAPNEGSTFPSQIVSVKIQDDPSVDPLAAFSIGIYENPAKDDLQIWFQQNVDVNNILTNAGTYQLKALPNGVNALVRASDLPEQYTEQRGGSFTEYLYFMSPSRDRVFSVGRGHDTSLSIHGYSAVAIDDLMWRVAGTFSF